MLTRPRASFSTIRASAPGLFRSRLANATSSTKRTRAFRSARLATTGLFTVMRIFPRPFTSAAERERARKDPHDREQSGRSEEHTSELQSLAYLVCRLL